jgi:hypothetical protein
MPIQLDLIDFVKHYEKPDEPETDRPPIPESSEWLGEDLADIYPAKAHQV